MLNLSVRWWRRGASGSALICVANRPKPEKRGFQLIANKDKTKVDRNLSVRVVATHQNPKIT